ncbi:uncharacterized protein LOC129581810 [Paramacrobiotus metropolitanus]|uniref:uncharacterized protein LOC129581810 n=1 Tax=Paramacrobiotus metropolitanus TaxID=2943436 RepID=UPI0024464CB2|nr:uncharacterized protein LOC129581810 [Paramacrobiotus metropolitanus]
MASIWYKFVPRRSHHRHHQPYIVLLLGETGSGKSTLINYLTNFFQGGDLLQPKIAVPNRYYRSTEAYTHSEKSIGDQSKSKTAKCSTYEFNLEGKDFRFIDSPGLSDTGGVQQDDQNVACILEAAEKAGALTAVILIINGTVSRATVNLSNTMARLRGNLPDVLIDNLIVVLTNCALGTYNFDFKSLLPWKIKSQNVFIMDNSALSRDPSDWQRNSHLMNGIQKAWNTSMDEIQKMVYRITDLDEKSTGVFKDLRDNREKIKEEMHKILLEINKLQQTQDELENAQNQRQAAMQDSNRYSNFKQTQEVEYSYLVDADYYSTMCIIHSTDRVCHDHCRLPETPQTNTGVHVKCACMNGGVRCQECQCGHETHYHARKKLARGKKTVEKILDDVKRQHDNAAVRFRESHDKVTKLRDDLKLLEQTLLEKQAQIESCCWELQRICSAFNFADEMNAVLVALQQNARTLRSVKARQEADKMIRAIEDVVRRLQPATSNRHHSQQDCDGYYEDFDSGLAQSRAGHGQYNNNTGRQGRSYSLNRSEGGMRYAQPDPATLNASSRFSIGSTKLSQLACRHHNHPSGCAFKNCYFEHICSNCGQSNHTALQCRAMQSAAVAASHALQLLPGACRYHNRPSGCRATDCKFPHICGYCARDNHNALQCRDRVPQTTANRSLGTPSKPGTSTTAISQGADAPCKYFNGLGGCLNSSCQFAHKCRLCGKLNHAEPTCNKKTVPVVKSKPAKPKEENWKNIPGVCYEFNRELPCKRSPCAYKHLCGICGQLHTALQHRRY